MLSFDAASSWTATHSSWRLCNRLRLRVSRCAQHMLRCTESLRTLAELLQSAKTQNMLRMNNCHCFVNSLRNTLNCRGRYATSSRWPRRLRPQQRRKPPLPLACALQRTSATRSSSDRYAPVAVSSIFVAASSRLFTVLPLHPIFRQFLTSVAAAGCCACSKLAQYEQQLASMQAEVERKTKLSEGLQLRNDLQQSKVRMHTVIVSCCRKRKGTHWLDRRHSAFGAGGRAGGSSRHDAVACRYGCGHSG